MVVQDFLDQIINDYNDVLTSLHDITDKEVNKLLEFILSNQVSQIE